MPPTSDPAGPLAYERSFHRVVYPVRDRPRFVFADGAAGRVVDCSECGVRYVLDAGHPLPRFGAVVEGRIEFRTSPPASIAGRVIRVADGAVALHVLSAPIPLRTLLDEQRALRARYPAASGGGGSTGGRRPGA